MTPATRHDVQTAVATLGAELRAELASKADLERYATKADLEGLERRLMAELGRIADSLGEYFRRLFAALTDKHDHLQGQVVGLRQELDAHVTDHSIHHTHARRRKPAKRARKHQPAR